MPAKKEARNARDRRQDAGLEVSTERHQKTSGTQQSSRESERCEPTFGNTGLQPNPPGMDGTPPAAAILTLSHSERSTAEGGGVGEPSGG